MFCLLAHPDKVTVRPLNLDQWEFYILSTNRLNNLLGEQKSIMLASLLRLSPQKSSFAELSDSIEKAAKEPSNAV